jgi:hypothetical protein
VDAVGDKVMHDSLWIRHEMTGFIDLSLPRFIHLYSTPTPTSLAFHFIVNNITYSIRT